MSTAPVPAISDARALLGACPILVLGAGRSGCALSAEFAQAGLPIVGIWNRSSIDRPIALGSTALLSGTDAPPQQWQDAARLVLLAVSDDAIADVAACLRLQPGTVVMHNSGALGSEVLPDIGPGIARGSYHPLQSFSDWTRSAIKVPPYAVALEGEDGAIALGAALAVVTGHQSVQLSSQQKAGYHAAAVLASNCLVALQSAATRVMGRATGDVSSAWELLWPLVMGTMAGLECGRPGEAITGPVARGDLLSIKRNQGALSGDPLATEIYKVLGREALEVALEGGLSESQVDSVRVALDSE